MKASTKKTDGAPTRTPKAAETATRDHHPASMPAPKATAGKLDSFTDVRESAAELVQATRTTHLRQVARALSSITAALDDHTRAVGGPATLELAEARADIARAFAELSDAESTLEFALRDLGYREPRGVEPNPA